MHTTTFYTEAYKNAIHFSLFSIPMYVHSNECTLFHWIRPDYQLTWITKQAEQDRVRFYAFTYIVSSTQMRQGKKIKNDKVCLWSAHIIFFLAGHRVRGLVSIASYLFVLCMQAVFFIIKFFSRMCTSNLARCRKPSSNSILWQLRHYSA